jgi:hypothetical protein
MGYPTRLVMYDFDWTLFRSPFPPGGQEKTWWDSPVSLNPPAVPMRSGKEWWIEEVVAEMKADQKRRDSLVVVITGRCYKLENRIAQILQHAGLKPEYLLTHDPSIRGERKVLKFKVNSVEELLATNQTLTTLVVWEDLESQLQALRKVAIKRRLAYEPNLVLEVERQLGWTP